MVRKRISFTENASTQACPHMGLEFPWIVPAFEDEIILILFRKLQIMQKMENSTVSLSLDNGSTSKIIDQFQI